jgi:glycogen debranching enzyme
MSSPTRHRHLEEQALALLQANRRSGYSGRHGLEFAYTCPSPGRYPYQWFWDSCFHAIVLSHMDPAWARKELLSLVSVQREDGSLPHVIFWQQGGANHFWRYLQADNPLRSRWTEYIQPPVLALAVLRVFQATGDREFADIMFACISRYHAWLRTSRDPDGDGLISLVSPFESGMDWSPQFDALFGGDISARWLGPRLLDLRHRLAGHETPRMLARLDVEEIATNSIWYDAQCSLAQLAAEIGDEKAAEAETLAAATTQAAILGKCWDPEASAFFSLSGRHERKLRVRTVASLLPLLLDQLSPEQLAAITSEIESPNGFGTPFPLPSVAVCEQSFQRRPGPFLWRGPAWLNMNWLAVRGLQRHGRSDLAAELAQASVRAVEVGGLRECYEPFDGRGMGARGFGWSTLVVDMLQVIE